MIIPYESRHMSRSPGEKRSHIVPDKPTISAVIVSYNGGSKVLRCLEKLKKQRTPLHEIIVVDNGSDDGSLQQIRETFTDVTIFEMAANRGLPAGRNVGLQHAAGDLVLLVDTDVYLTDDCTCKLLQAYFEEQATVVCPRILLLPEDDVVQCDGAAAHFVGTMILRHGFSDIATTPSKRATVNGCIGACMLAERTTVLAAGSFNEAFFLYFEDHEFSLRMRSLGHRFICEPMAIVHHERGDGTPGMAFRGHGNYPRQRAYQTMHGRLTTILIHYRFRTMAVLAPVLLSYELISIAVALRRGWAGEWLRVWLWQFRNRRTVLMWRNRVQQARRVGDRDLLEGGSLPVAPGFARSRWDRAVVASLSTVFNGYWNLMSWLIR